MTNQIHPSWQSVLSSEFEKKYFKVLLDFVREAYQTRPERVFPKQELIFNAFNLCPFDKIKVVIIGQDPYPTQGHAHGLCFSVEKDVSPIPKSLANIYKELYKDLNLKPKKNGSLEYLAHQGVLLLNSILTVEEGRPESHKGRGWETFTDEVLHQINQRHFGIVFLLWGSKAIQKKRFIDPKRHLILESVHPSPLSAYRGFFGCKHFSKTNSFLKRHGKGIIQW